MSLLLPSSIIRWQRLGFALVLFLLTTTVRAQQTGIFQTTVRIDNFDRAGNSNAGNVTPYEGATLGQGGYSPGNAGLILDGGEIKTFKNNGGDVTSATLYYRVYLQGSATRGSTSPGYTALNLPFGANLGSCDNNGCDQRWTLTGANINLAAGLTQRGTYVVEVYWKITTNLGDRFDSNFGQNYVATFGFTGSPLCGTYTVNNALAPSADNFVSFGTAFTSLNSAGVNCATTFNVRDNQVFAENNVQLNAVAGTSSTTRVTFQRDNSTATGANVRPVVRPVANSGGGTQDAIIKLNGADFITFDGIDVTDVSTGTNAQKMEYGYALFRPTTTDGCQNNIIRNCAVTLTKSNSGTIGLYSAATTISGGTALVASVAAGANSSNEFDGNTITNTYLGISLVGSTGTFPDVSNKVGSTTGNGISNIGGTIATDVYGIRAEYQNGLSIERNTISIPTGNTTANIRGIGTGIANSSSTITGSLLINANTVTIVTGSTGFVRGIHQAGSGPGSVSITNNQILNSALSGATGTVTWLQDESSNSTTPQAVAITGNQVTGNTTATSGVVAGIYRSGGQAASVTLSNNQVLNNSNSAASQFYGLQVASASLASTPITVSGNQVSGNQLTGATGAMFCVNLNTGALTFSSNTISNNTIPNTTGPGSSSLYGYFQSAAPSAETLTGNTITGLSIGGTGTGVHDIRGISSSPSNSPAQVYTQNTVGGLSIAGGGSGAVSGIRLLSGGGSGTSIARNKLYDLSAAGTSGTATGIQVDGGGTFAFSNNLLGDFRAPAASATSAVNGFALNGGTAANLYFNTVYLNASSSSATFGTSGLLLGATAPVVDLRNNIVANLSTPAGATGTTAALRRNGVNATNGNFASTTNNNLYWAGTPGPANVIFTDGTVTAQTLAAYKTLLAPRESNSVTENPPVSSTDGTQASFLHIQPNVATQVESGGTPVAGISIDYDGDTRNATTPDIGADEGTFRPASTLPVELAAFAATRAGSTALLEWTTALEKNNIGFEVQQSRDGLAYQVLGFVAGAGSSLAPHHYRYVDAEGSKTGLRYYRLRQLNTDGTASYSPVRTVDFGGIAPSPVVAFPLPFGEALTLRVQAATAQTALLRLADAAGRVVLAQLLAVPAGSSQLPITGLEMLPAGLYWLHTTLDGQLVQLKVLKQ